MRHALALVLSAGLCAGALALVQPPPTDPAKPAGQPAPAAQAVSAPPKPEPIPVPSGPVIEKKDLDGGLVVEELKIGDGVALDPNSVFVARYHGTLKEGGKVIDSTYDRGESSTIPLINMIKGWQQGLPGMKVGGVRRLTIPSALAYGAAGRGQLIPPNSDLVFVIEVVSALKVEDVKEGEGEPATNRCVVSTAYVIKDADGKEIEKADAKNPYIWLPGEYQPIMFGITGMKVGGKRILTVPKEMNLTTPELADKRPGNVPVTMEIELLGLRNIPNPGGR